MTKDDLGQTPSVTPPRDGAFGDNPDYPYFKEHWPARAKPKGVIRRLGAFVAYFNTKVKRLKILEHFNKNCSHALKLVIEFGRANNILDLRERILSSYDKKEGTRPEIARRFRVSLGLVKKLLQQRRHTGDIAPRHRFSGRKPMIVQGHRRQIQGLLAKKCDLTLQELRQATGLKCSLQAINVVLGKMGLTYKKRRSMPASKIGPTSAKPVASGVAAKGGWIRPD